MGDENRMYDSREYEVFKVFLSSFFSSLRNQGY